MIISTEHAFQRELCSTYVYTTELPRSGSNSTASLLTRRMVWHYYYGNIHLITLWTSTIFSAETTSKANMLKTTLVCHYNLSVYFEISQTGTHDFGRFLLIIQGTCCELSFFYLLSTVVNPLLTGRYL